MDGVKQCLESSYITYSFAYVEAGISGANEPDPDGKAHGHWVLVRLGQLYRQPVAFHQPLGPTG